MKKISFQFFKKLPEQEKRITLSTLITLARIVAVPFIIGSMVIGRWGLAFSLFSVAAISDALDGNLARWRNEKTFLGACLDPIADKLLVLSVFFTLAFVQTPLFTIPLWFVLLVLIKELVLIIGAFIIYSRKGHIEIAPTILGKLTTVVQMSFIMWLFACYFFAWLPIKTYFTMLGILLFLTFVVLLQYIAIGLMQWRTSSIQES